MLDSHSQELTEGDFAARLLWAKRQGNPAWLWPDIEMVDWRVALHAIAQIVRVKLSGARPFRALDGDPAAIGLACYTSGMGPLLGWWLEQGKIAATRSIGDVLALHLDHNRRRTEGLIRAATDVAGRFLRHHIPVLVLKGAHTATEYFPDPATRPASDIDLLVADTQAIAAGNLLQDAGFQLVHRAARESTWRPNGVPTDPRSLMFVHADDPWSIDLHNSLDYVVAGGAPMARLDALRPLDHVEPWRPLPKAGVLEQPILLLHLATHAGAGLHNLTLLRLVELQMVISQDLTSGRLSWRDFLGEGERTHLLGFAYPALDLCEKLVPGTVPQAVLEQCAAAAPIGVQRLVAALQPAIAQRIGRGSFAEHFMWSPGWRDRARQLAHDIYMPKVTWKMSRSIYETRAWQLIRAVSR
jgi:hypothetical protein